MTPLDPRFVRKLSLLCCHCVRNIAYYHVGFIGEDGTGDLKHPSEFGVTVNGNMLDIDVLEWCKLFVDGKARHHWKRFVRKDADQHQFLAGLLTTAEISLDDWKRYLDEMRVYRDKFVAHLDDQHVMKIPRLELALKCVFFSMLTCEQRRLPRFSSRHIWPIFPMIWRLTMTLVVPKDVPTMQRQGLQTDNGKTTEAVMANHLLYEFRQDEQDDFSAVCKKYGRSVDEFDVRDEDQYPAGGAVGPIRREVTVALRGKDAMKLYDGGHVSRWIVDFEDDLKAGVFD
ncbi:hypothetical protein V4C85_24020 [Ralstonia solanacearum]|uniref:hypothetical protein n=1 Tax=Ralstonia solanacearum TaxID=305 RepID=UPI0007D858A2|nr:hypothetical protein [Ralstonia solanacearum]OAI60167.1 hypothetical protein RSP597_23400 [Ralstonia solanacearum]